MASAEPVAPTAAARDSARRLRVMLVTGEYPPDEGGVADYTRCLAEALAARRVSVDVLTRRRASPRPDVSAGAGGRGAAARLADGKGTLRPDRIRVAEHRAMRGWGWPSLRAINRAASKLRPDVVHVQYQAAAYDMAPAIHLAPSWLALSARFGGSSSSSRARSGGHPLTAVTFHDLRVPYLFPKAGRVRRAAIRHLAASADLAVATNAEDAATVGAWLAPDRLALVPIGSNVPDAVPPGYDRSEWRRANGLTPTADVLVYFGFLNESKGARSIVGALDRLVSQGRDARLVMLGGRLGASDATNAEYLSRFETDLERHGLAVRVLWTGHVPSAEVSAWFHAADVAVLPYEDGASFRRGSLLAALAHGAPVVTTIPSTTPDALVHPALAERPPELEDHRSALLVPPGDVAALARAIAEVLDDPALAAALAKAARATAAGFGWEAIAGRHVELYRRMLERRARA